MGDSTFNHSRLKNRCQRREVSNLERCRGLFVIRVHSEYHKLVIRFLLQRTYCNIIDLSIDKMRKESRSAVPYQFHHNIIIRPLRLSKISVYHLIQIISLAGRMDRESNASGIRCHLYIKCNGLRSGLELRSPEEIRKILASGGINADCQGKIVRREGKILYNYIIVIVAC